jgi:hypothetical protein
MSSERACSGMMLPAVGLCREVRRADPFGSACWRNESAGILGGEDAVVFHAGIEALRYVELAFAFGKGMGSVVLVHQFVAKDSVFRT